MGNPFVHVELATTDADKAKSFYQSLFDWQLSDIDMGGGMSYTMINVGEGTGGGMMKQIMPNAPSAWLPYVQVDDIRTATDTAKLARSQYFRSVFSSIPVLKALGLSDFPFVSSAHNRRICRSVTLFIMSLLFVPPSSGLTCRRASRAGGDSSIPCYSRL